MNGQHTPGPLRLFELGDRIKRLCPADATGQSLLTIVEEDGVQFAAVLEDEDARLFAVAPEMPALLNDINNWLVCHAIASAEDMAQSFGPFQEQIEALLKKAPKVVA